MVVKIAKTAVLKLLFYKNGSLFLVNGGFSAGIVFYINELLRGTDTKNLVLPIVIYIIGFFIYHIFSLIDLITGLMNAKYQNSILPNPEKSYIKNYKLWFSIWKNLGITVFAFMVMMMCMLTEIIKGDSDGFIEQSMYTASIWFLVTTWLMASAFEFHSIGENIERRTGSKPMFFGLASKLTDIAQSKIILKARNSFDMVEKIPEEENKEIPDENEKVN